LKKFNASENCKLTSIALDGLFQLSSEGLMLQGCPDLQTVNLNKCAGIEELDLSNAASTLTSVKITYCKGLKKLTIKNASKLKEFSVEGCTNLEELDLEGCAIITPYIGL